MQEKCVHNLKEEAINENTIARHIVLPINSITSELERNLANPDLKIIKNV